MMIFIGVHTFEFGDYYYTILYTKKLRTIFDQQSGLCRLCHNNSHHIEQCEITTARDSAMQNLAYFAERVRH
jgi:hypothetical protein